jgi:hypothetical protein
MCVLLLTQMVIPATGQLSSKKGNDFKLKIEQSAIELGEGRAVTFTVKIKKQNPSDEIQLSISPSPLLVGRVDNSDSDAVQLSTDEELVSFRAVAPVGIELKPHKITITATNGNVTHRASATVVVSQLTGPIVTSAAYSNDGAILFLGGIGFGSSPTVKINGKDVSTLITSSDDTSVQLDGHGQGQLHLKAGANEIVVVNDGVESNLFILNLRKF